MYFKIILILIFSLVCSYVDASERELVVEDLLRTDLLLERGSVKRLILEQNYYVNHLIIHAEGVRHDSMFEILVNDVVKGTIYAPGRDPIYVVTIRDTTREIVLKHLQGASARITKVEMHRSVQLPPDYSGGLPHIRNSQLSVLSLEAIAVINKIEVLIPHDEFRLNLLSVKIAAGHLHSVAQARGDLSRRSVDALSRLQMNYLIIRPYLNKLLMRTETFSLALDLLINKERLLRLTE